MINSDAWRHGSLFASVAQAWRNWRGRPARPTQSRDPARAVAPAAIGGRSALRAWPGKWPDSTDLLTRRMVSLQIDPIAFRTTLPELAREAERNCVLCRDQVECRHDLDHKIDDLEWDAKCPNSEVLRALHSQSGAHP